MALLTPFAHLHGQVVVAPIPPPRIQFLSGNGTPLANGCVFSYDAGTSTPRATYTDSTGSSTNTNPVILDAGGFANIWLGPQKYKISVYSAGGTNCALGTLQYTVDGISSSNLPVTGSVVFTAQAAPTCNAADYKLWADSGATFLKMCNNGTIDTVSGVTATQTLTNKTLTSPTINSPTIAGTATVSAITNLNGVTTAADFSISALVRDCRADGVVADGVTDDGVHINNCVANAVAANQAIAQLPSGSIAVKTGINLTNLKGFRLRGAAPSNNSSAQATILLCNTNTVPCIDRTGSSYTHLSDFAISATGTNQSSVVLLLGRDNAGGGGSSNPFCYGEFNHDDNLYILSTNANAMNAGRGSVAIYNINAEIYTITDSNIQADTAAYFSTTNGLSIASAYQTLQTGCPSSMTAFTAINSWFGVNTSATNGGGILASNAKIFNLVNVGFQGNNNANGIYAISFNGTSQNWNITGSQESLTLNGTTGGFAFFNQSSDHIMIDVAIGGYTGTGGAYIGEANGVTLSDSSFRVNSINGAQEQLVGNAGAYTLSNVALDLASTVVPSNFSNVTLTNGTVKARGFTDANLGTYPFFASGSSFQLSNTTGIKFIGKGPSVVYSWGCNGVATASQTLYLSGPGSATPACTKTTAGKDFYVPTRAGSAHNLQVNCAAAGKAANSGVFTLVLGGSDTALTCTVGTGNACSDVADDVPFALPSTVQIKFTTQASETLADCNASVELN